MRFFCMPIFIFEFYIIQISFYLSLRHFGFYIFSQSLFRRLAERKPYSFYNNVVFVVAENTTFTTGTVKIYVLIDWKKNWTQIPYNVRGIHTWNKRKAYPFGGKYDLLSALWGQSTTNWPNLRKLAVISSGKNKKPQECYDYWYKNN